MVGALKRGPESVPTFLEISEIFKTVPFLRKPSKNLICVFYRRSPPPCNQRLKTERGGGVAQRLQSAAPLWGEGVLDNVKTLVLKTSRQG